VRLPSASLLLSRLFELLDIRTFENHPCLCCCGYHLWDTPRPSHGSCLRRILHGFPSACFRHSIAYAVGIPMGCHSNLVGWPFPRIVSGPGCPSRSVPKVIRQRAVAPIARLLLVMACCALAAGITGFFLANHRLLSEPEWMSPVLPPTILASWLIGSLTVLPMRAVSSVELFSACCNIEDGPFVHLGERPKLRRNRFLALKIVVLMAERRRLSVRAISE